MAKMGFEKNRRLVMDWHNEPQDVMIDGRHYHFRSKLEYRWAQYLQLLLKSREIKGWRYEPFAYTFPGETKGVVQYTPDFVVYENDGPETIHETKGWLIGKDNTKFKRMQKHYPDIKIWLVMAKKDSAKKRVNRYRTVQKYVERIVYADKIFRQAGIK